MKELTKILTATFLLACICFLFTSCDSDLLVKTLEVDDFDYEKQLAISGALIPTESEFKLLISENQAITDPFDQWEPAPDAKAILLKEGEEIGQLNFDANHPDGLNNVFRLNIQNLDLTPGNYRLEVEHPSFGSAFAETEIPANVEIESVEFVEDYGFAPESLTNSDAVVVTFSDPPEDDYYALKLVADNIIVDTFISGTDTIIYEQNRYVYVESNVPGGQSIANGVLFDDSFFNGREFTVALFLPDLNYQEDKEEYLSNLKVSWDVVSRDKFEFDRSLELYFDSQGFGPFTEALERSSL